MKMLLGLRNTATQEASRTLAAATDVEMELYKTKWERRKVRVTQDLLLVVPANLSDSVSEEGEGLIAEALAFADVAILGSRGQRYHTRRLSWRRKSTYLYNRKW